MVPREAHNLQTPVRVRAPQQVIENTPLGVFSFCIIFDEELRLLNLWQRTDRDGALTIITIEEECRFAGDR